MTSQPDAESHSPDPFPVSTDTLKISDFLYAANLNGNKERFFEGEYLFEDIPSEAPIRAKWRIQPETAGLTVHGTVSGVLRLECSRCLAPYSVDVSVSMDERYVFSRFTEEFGREKELLADDFYETLDEEGWLDLKDLARQFLLLELENHALCGKADCRFTLL